MFRFILSIVILALSCLFVAPTASATPTNAEFQELSRQVNGLRLANARLEERVVELEVQAAEVDGLMNFVSVFQSPDGSWHIQVEGATFGTLSGFLAAGGLKHALSVEGDVFMNGKGNSPINMYIHGTTVQNTDTSVTVISAFGLQTTGDLKAQSVFGQDYLLETPDGGVLNFTVAFSYLRNTLFQYFGVPTKDTSLDSFGDWVSAALGQ